MQQIWRWQPEFLWWCVMLSKHFRKQVATACLTLTMLSGCGDATISGLSEDTVTEPDVVLFSIFQDATGVTMTNAAALGTEITSNVSRAYVDLTGYSEARGQFTSSLTSAVVNCRVEFSLDNGTSWSVLIPNFAASTVANSNSRGVWGEIPSNAQSSVLLRAVIVGNGVLDPVIRYVRVEVR